MSLVWKYRPNKIGDGIPLDLQEPNKSNFKIKIPWWDYHYSDINLMHWFSISFELRTKIVFVFLNQSKYLLLIPLNIITSVLWLHFSVLIAALRNWSVNSFIKLIRSKMLGPKVIRFDSVNYTLKRDCIAEKLDRGK